MIRKLSAFIILTLALCAPHAASAYLQTYEPGARRYFDQATVNGCAAGSTVWKAAVNQLVIGLKADGLWTTLDASYLFASADECTAKINLVNPAYMPLTKSGTCTFTAYTSWAGNGVDCSLSTGVAWNALKHYAQDSAHIGAWKHANGSVSSATWGYVTGVQILLRVGTSTGGNLTSRVNVNASVTDTAGALANMYFTATRNSSSAFSTYRNGAVLTNEAASTSATVAASNALILQDSTNFSGIALSIADAGSGLNATQEANLYARYRAFLRAIGVAAVQ